MNLLKENIVLVILMGVVAIVAFGAVLIQSQEQPASEPKSSAPLVLEPAVSGNRYLGEEISFRLPKRLTASSQSRSILLEGSNRGVISIFDLPVYTSLNELQRQYKAQRRGNGLIYQSQPGSSQGLLLIGPYRVDYLLLGPGSRAKLIELLESTRLRER